ncbi:uncharacterized protein LOC117343967 [Pecten maximus]|uniref:uncharacterized protein LOC117343967 n=1 Tax=Pecten maximus TaxID=6579 RepID=UPI001458D371|nr:uncharacterized protein LOC117343967 [Pecten maximus]
MDLFSLFTIPLVMELLLNADAGDVMSSLLGSPEDITCTDPFLWLNTIGYIQCQRECIRYSICDVLQFKKDQLECRLYVASNCYTNLDPNIYLKRTDINESVFKGCDREGCPASICIRLRGGQHTCVLSKVIAEYNSSGANFVEVDGVFFGIHTDPHLVDDSASNVCVSYGGRLAILNTQRKIWMIITAMQARTVKPRYLLVGAYKDNGEARWATGETVQSTKVVIRDEGSCFVLRLDDNIIDTSCTYRWPFICELTSGI